MLILASQSPRRREILAAAGYEFAVVPANVPEVRAENEDPAAFVQRLAKEKACAVAVDPDCIVIGADTTVVVGDCVLEKPVDRHDAVRMLRLLSGRGHEVLTGICLRRGANILSDVVSTRVYFSELSEAEIDAYVATGEPMDKAGAYAIQGLASKFIERIEGDYFNVVGLPIALVYRRLKTLE